MGRQTGEAIPREVNQDERRRRKKMTIRTRPFSRRNPKEMYPELANELRTLSVDSLIQLKRSADYIYELCDELLEEREPIKEIDE
jgi:hypothetical protein